MAALAVDNDSSCGCHCQPVRLALTARAVVSDSRGGCQCQPVRLSETARDCLFYVDA